MRAGNWNILLCNFFDFGKHLKTHSGKKSNKFDRVILRHQKSGSTKLKHSFDIYFFLLFPPFPFLPSLLPFSLSFETLKYWLRQDFFLFCPFYLIFICVQIHCWSKIILPFFFLKTLKYCIDWDKIQDFTKVHGWFAAQTFYGKCFNLKFGFYKVGNKKKLEIRIKLEKKC